MFLPLKKRFLSLFLLLSEIRTIRPSLYGNLENKRVMTLEPALIHSKNLMINANNYHYFFFLSAVVGTKTAPRKTRRVIPIERNKKVPTPTPESPNQLAKIFSSTHHSPI
jgi:hypothetical protein